MFKDQWCKKGWCSLPPKRIKQPIVNFPAVSSMVQWADAFAVKGIKQLTVNIPAVSCQRL
jgi:hypothetical protein